MPSTFTSNTGIELLADGEQAGAWGQTTNDNFDIVDRALNGSVSIALSGTTHTLTTSNGVLSDGQFAVLVFTGSPSATNTVTIEPDTAQKTYFVTNSTAQTVVLSQGSGANVSVPAGLSKIVFTNGAGAGAAVFDITNTLSGNLTGNVTGDLTGNVTGNLTGNVTGNVTGNAGTATALQTARTLGGVSFDGTASINLPGVNVAGNQNTTGNAATATLATSATALETARTINGVSFNGTANITLPTVNTTGDQTIAGVKTFSSAVVLSTAGTATTQAVRADRDIATGTGLSGGGNLTANRTLSIDIATQAESQAGTSNVKVITPLRVKDALNAAGGAPIFACRAWVNFNGKGTVAIRASGNVSSITDNGTGDYTINFTTNMPDANYCWTQSAGDATNANRVALTAGANYSATISSLRVRGSAGSGYADMSVANVAVFR